MAIWLNCPKRYPELETKYTPRKKKNQNWDSLILLKDYLKLMYIFTSHHKGYFNGDAWSQKLVSQSVSQLPYIISCDSIKPMWQQAYCDSKSSIIIISYLHWEEQSQLLESSLGNVEMHM